MSTMGTCVDCGKEIGVMGHAAISPKIGYRCSECEALFSHKRIDILDEECRNLKSAIRSALDRIQGRPSEMQIAMARKTLTDAEES